MKVLLYCYPLEIVVGLYTVLADYAEQEGNHVITEISDTGCGIPKENLEKIFDAFYTTKEEGTGLGLSTSYRIIEEHKGRIKVESPPACLPTGKTGRAGELGKGTTFMVKLPIVKY